MWPQSIPERDWRLVLETKLSTMQGITESTYLRSMKRLLYGAYPFSCCWIVFKESVCLGTFNS